MLEFVACLIVGFIIVSIPLSIVTLFHKSIKIGQRIAIGVSLMAVLCIIFLPIFEVLNLQFSGVKIIKFLFTNSYGNIIELSRDMFDYYMQIPVLLAVMTLAPTISMTISSFYKDGGVIGGIVMYGAMLWLLYQLFSVPYFEIGAGVYAYAICASFTCFTPLFNEKDKE